MVMAYDAQPATTIATAASSPTHTVNETSGPPSPRMPRSRVCCTAIGTTTWPSEATHGQHEGAVDAVLELG